MAMNGNTLGTDIANSIMHPNATPEARAAVLELWQNVGNIIVRHIQDNAEVLDGIGVSTNVSTIVTTNPATGSGTGTGTGTGKTTEIGKVR